MIVNLTTVLPLSGTVIVPVGDSVHPVTVCAKAGVAEAPRVTSVASNPRIIADFLFSRLIDAGERFSIYIASGARPHAHEP